MATPQQRSNAASPDRVGRLANAHAGLEARIARGLGITVAELRGDPPRTPRKATAAAR